jgi:hypothetical protein
MTAFVEFDYPCPPLNLRRRGVGEVVAREKRVLLRPRAFR